MGTQNSAMDKIKFFSLRFAAAKNQGYSIDKEKLIAQFVITQFSTRRKALELIKTFITAEEIYEENGQLGSKKLFRECSQILPQKQKSLIEEL